MRPEAFAELQRAVYTALRAYSNVHRGSGHFSLVSTALYEKAREIVRRDSGVKGRQYETIFSTSHGARALLKNVRCRDYALLSSADLGLPLGVSALVLRKRCLPRGAPPRTGGGVVKLVSRNSVVWSPSPERYEAGTPAVINVIAFAKALELQRKYGKSVFKSGADADFPVQDLFDRDAFSTMRGEELLARLRENVVGQQVSVPVEKGSLAYANLDNAASTPALEPVWEVFKEALRTPPQRRPVLVDAARGICRDFLNAPEDAYDVFFTGNTTDSLNIVAEGFDPDGDPDTETVVANTLLEHHSNELVWRDRGHVFLERLPVDAAGFLDPSLLEKTLQSYNEKHLHGKKRIRLVAVCGISNVLGTVQNLKGIGMICRRYGAKLLVDAAQLAAHREIDMLADGIDILALSGHKMYAPFGAGVLAIRKKLLAADVRAALRGNENENAAGIAALAKAMHLLKRVGLKTVANEENRLTEMLLRGLAKNRGLDVHGVTDTRAPEFRNRAGIVVLGMKKVPHNRVVKELAEKGGIGVRDGCFCSHILVKDLLGIGRFREKLAEWLLHLLPGIAHPSSLLPGLVRISLGIENNEREIRRLLDTLTDIAAVPRSRVDRFIASRHNGTPFVKKTAVQKEIEAFVRGYVDTVFDSGGAGSR